MKSFDVEHGCVHIVNGDPLIDFLSIPIGDFQKWEPLWTPELDQAPYIEKLTQYQARWREENPSFTVKPELRVAYGDFRIGIARLDAYEQVLDKVAAKSPTRHSSVLLAWSKVEDLASLEVAIQFWNVGVVPVGISPEEAKSFQSVADQMGIPILFDNKGMISR